MSPETRYDAVWRRAEPYMRARKNDIHLPLSFAWAQRLLDHYPEADRDICSLAILLHDIGWFTIDSDRIVREGFRAENFLTSDVRVLHEIEGVRLARDVLADTGWDALIDPVCKIIDGHDTRAHPHDLNDRIVRDADKLWRFEVTGVAIASDWFGETPHQNVLRNEAYIDQLETEYGQVLARAETQRTRAALVLHAI